MTAFSTTAEVLALLAPVRDAIERLPVDGMDSLGAVTGACERLAAAIAAVAVVDPAEARATHRYRQVHGLAPIEEETTSA